MANTHTTLSSLFTAIANAIRSKTGGTEPIVADQFPEAIAGIEGGGAKIETCTVAFCTDCWIEQSEFVSVKYAALVDGVITTKTVASTDENFFGSYTDVVRGTLFFIETADYFWSSYGENTDYQGEKNINNYCWYIIDKDGAIGFWGD